MANYVAPTGYVELDNDCEFDIDRKSTRSRESINPTEDLAFYFNTYIKPKYGLGNINVSNTASFLKELDMNWSKLSPDLKDNVLDIMVDGIFKTGDYDFKSKLMSKLNINLSPPILSKSNFTEVGQSSNKNITLVLIGVVVLVLILFLLDRIQFKSGSFAKFT